MGLRTVSPFVTAESKYTFKFNLGIILLLQVVIGILAFQLAANRSTPITVAEYNDWLLYGSASIGSTENYTYREFGPDTALLLAQPSLHNQATLWLALPGSATTTQNFNVIINGRNIQQITLVPSNSNQLKAFTFDWWAFSPFPTASLSFQPNQAGQVLVSRINVESANFAFIKLPSLFVTLLYLIVSAFCLWLFYRRFSSIKWSWLRFSIIFTPALLLFTPLWLGLTCFALLVFVVLYLTFWPALNQVTPVPTASFVSQKLPELQPSAQLFQKRPLKQSKLDNLIAVGLFACAFLTYTFTTSNQLNGSNDGSHLALARSIAETGRFEISPFFGYTLALDYAQTPDGKRYSDRPPGTGWLTAGFVKAAKTTASSSLLATQIPALALLEQPRSPLWTGFAWVLLVPTLCGALSVVLLYKLTRFWGASMLSAGLGAGYFGFATIAWKYSLTLYSHAPGTALLLGGVYLNLSAQQRRWRNILGCFLLGYACTVDYTNLLPALTVFIYLIVINRKDLTMWRQKIRVWLPALMAFGLPLLALAIYQTICFGSPLNTSYSYSGKWEWARSVGGTFTRLPFEGLWNLYFGWKPTTGLLPLSPALLLGVWGSYFVWKRQRNHAILLAGLILPTTILMSCHYTYFGGGDEDARYLLVTLPYLVLPLAFWLDDWVLKFRNLIWRFGWSIFFIGTFLYSIFANLRHIYNDYPFRYLKSTGQHGLDDFGLPDPTLPVLVNPSALPLALFITLLIILFWQHNFANSWKGVSILKSKHSVTATLRLFVSVVALCALFLALAGPQVVPAQATAPADNGAAPHGSSLNIPYPRLGAPYTTQDEYPAGDIDIGCCKNGGSGAQGPRPLDPMLAYQFVDVGAYADVAHDGSANPGNGQDFKYLRSHAPNPNNLILVMYIDDREISINDTDYAMLSRSHPDYLLSDTAGNPLYFDQPNSRTLRMFNLSNSGTLDYLKNRVLSRLQAAPTIDGYYIDGNDPDLNAQIAVHQGVWGTPANVDETAWHNNENAFLSYIGTIGRDGVNNNPQIHSAVVLANASHNWDNYNGSAINGSLNTDSVNIVEKGGFSLSRVFNGINGDGDGYFPDMANARTPVITNMTVDASPTWLTPSASTDNSHDPNVTGQNNYRRLRFGLTTALMGDAFFQFNRDSTHPGVYPDASTTWWYDEYNNAKGYNLNNPAQTANTGYLGSAASDHYYANVTAGLNGAQVIQDSGFENLTGAPNNDQWYNIAPQNGAQASFGPENNPANVHSGAKSGLLNVTNPDTGNQGYDYFSAGVAHQSDIPLVAGHHYTLSGYAKSDATRGVVFKVQGSGGAYFSSPDFTGNYFSVSPADGYKQFSYNFVASQNDGAANLLALSGTVRGKLWLDDVKLVDTDAKPDVYERDFQNGTAIVNGTDTQVTVSLAKPYTHINGTQDRSVNDGTTVTSVTIKPYDGVILLNAQAAAGCQANCNNVYNLPLLAKDADTPVGHTTTYVTFQNLSGSPANVTVQYYGIADGSAGSKDTLQLPAKGQQAIVPGFGAGQSFGGVISSDQPLNVVVSESLNAGGSAYNVSPSTASTLYSPLALNGQYGFQTSMIVFNPGGATTNVTIQFYDETGTLSGNTQNFNLPAHASKTLSQADPGSGLNANHPYWAKITGGGALSAQVIEFGPANFVATFNALPQTQAKTKVFAPAAFNGAFGSYVTGMAIANTSNSAATGNITYYDATGNVAQTQPINIPANGVIGVFQPAAGGPPSGFSGSATISSNQPLVVTVNERASGTISGTYAGLTTGSQNLGLPVMANGFAGFVSGTTILNVGSSATNITLSYLNADGSAVGNPQTTTLAPNASFQLYQGAANQGLPGGFFGTAIITSSSSALLATTNALSPNFFYTYTEPSN